MLTPGLVSVTFRKLTPEEIIALSAKAGVQSIEWGGDIHVPAGDVARAKEVGQQTRDAGLMVAAYGSYYRLAGGGRFPAPFEQVLATAAALGAPTIRIWAGVKGAKVCPPKERAAIVAEIEAQLRPALFRDGAWWADYRRLRIVAQSNNR